MENLNRSDAVEQSGTAAGSSDSLSGPALIEPAGHPVLRIEFDFDLPGGSPASALDPWLVGVFGLEIPSELCGLSREEARSDAGQFLVRVLLFARGLIQLAQVPAFGAPRVLCLREVAGARDAFRATILMPTIDLMPKACWEQTLSLAFRGCIWFARRPVTAQAIDSFTEQASRVVSTTAGRIGLRGRSTLPLMQAAHDLGMPLFHLGRGVFQIGVGSRSRRFERSTVDADSAIGARNTQDKATTADLLRFAGLPAPRHGVVIDYEAARAVAAEIGWPVVVKPVDRDRGEGVEVDIEGDEALRAAFDKAVALSGSRRVIVEQQVAGVCHRLFLADGRLLYAVARHPMAVVGDGTSNVARLVQREVDRQRLMPSWTRSGIRPLDGPARAAIAAAGFTELSVPSAGERVPLRRIESTQWGGMDEDVSDRVHPENLRVAIAAAAQFGLTVAGIDIISSDISMPWFDNGAVINEVNYAPLLGGGEISRARIPSFIAQFVPGNGRIPMELFVGGERAWGAALERRRELAAAGARAWAISPDETIGSSGDPVRLAIGQDAFARARAVCLDSSVDAIVIACGVNAAVDGRWPIEYLDRVVEIDPA